MKTIALVVMMCGLALAKTSWAGESGFKQIVVLDLASNDADKELAGNLTEIMVETVRETVPGVRVIGQSEIQTMLALEAQKGLMGCTDASCLAEIGGALGADHMLTGKLGRIGAVYLLSLKLINTAKAEVINHRSKRISGNVEQLIDKVLVLVKEVMVLPETSRRTTGAVSSGETSSGEGSSGEGSSGEGSSGEGSSGEGSSGEGSSGSASGAVASSAQARESEATAQLPAEATQAGPAAAENDDGGVVTKWWFWTIIGGVVAAGAAGTAAAVVLSSGGGATSGTVQVSITP